MKTRNPKNKETNLFTKCWEMPPTWKASREHNLNKYKEKEYEQSKSKETSIQVF